MKKVFRRVFLNILCIVFLINTVPVYLIAPLLFLNDSVEVKAFATQNDSLAPGYIIKAEAGGLTFELTERLDEDMTVEKFSFKNTDSTKKDKVEEKIDEDGLKWISRDELIHNNIYEIETEIYNAATKKTEKFINSFKFNDQNLFFRPKVSIDPLKSGQTKFSAQDLLIDLSSCKDIIDKLSSSDFKLDILNSNLTKTPLDTVNIRGKSIKDNNYKLNILHGSGVLYANKDYVIRLSVDDFIWESIFSTVIKPKPSFIRVFQPNHYRVGHTIQYNTSTRQFVIPLNNLSYDLQGTANKIKVLMKDKTGSLPVKMVEIQNINNDAVIVMPEEYLGIPGPNDIEISLVSNSGFVISSFSLQFNAQGANRGLRLFTSMNVYEDLRSDGIFIKGVSLKDWGDTATLPHSWNNLPKAHYITLYDANGVQIGGQFRIDVKKNKSQFFAVHDLTSSNFYIKFSDMKQGFNTFNFKIESSNALPEWAQAQVPNLYYVDMLNLNSFDMTVKEVEPFANGNGYNFILEPNNINISSGDTIKIIDDEGNEHSAICNDSKTFKFSNIPLKFGGKYVTVFKDSTSLLHFQSIKSSLFFNPITVADYVDGEEGLQCNLDDDMRLYLNSNGSQNTIKVLDMNGNATENIFEGAKIGSNKFKLSKPLNDGERYIIEFSNGSDKFRSTFLYTKFNVSLEDVTSSTVKLDWKYPDNYLIMSGDTLKIYFKKEGTEYPAVPNAKIMHGFQDIDFSKVRTYTMKDLNPNMNYRVKLELITSQGIIFTGELDFVTTDFKVTDLYINNVNEEGVVYDKNISLGWDINQNDLEFSDKDRVDIYLKLKSHSSFPKTPVKSITEDLNRIRLAELEVPNYEQEYSVMISYLIGGAKISSKVIDFNSKFKGINVQIEEAKESTVKISWDYPEDNVFEEGQEIRIYLKKKNASIYDNKKTQIFVHSSSVNLEELKSSIIEGLQPNTEYDIKFEYKIENVEFAGVSKEIVSEKLLDFTSKDFSVFGITMEPRDSIKSVKVLWSVSNREYIYMPTDNVKVYFKESSQTDYPSSPQATISKENLSNKYDVNLDFEKYDKNYDIKIVYRLSCKDYVFYGKYRTEIGDIVPNIDSITDNEIGISWTYPTNYNLVYGDRLEILTKKYDDSGDFINSFSVTHSGNINMAEVKSKVIEGFETGVKYILKLRFIPSQGDVIENQIIFKAVSGFQIPVINLKNINSTSMNLDWSIYPLDYRFSSGDKCEIFSKLVGEVDYGNPKKTQTQNLSEFNNFKIEGLQKDKEHSFKIKYTISGTEYFEEIRGTPKFGEFGAYITDAKMTDVVLGILYPEGYDITEGDALDIFIKPSTEAQFDSKPVFSAVHGTEEENVDLNEVYNLEITRLSPGVSYDTRVVFWMNGGRGEKLEKLISFRTKQIDGIEELEIIESMDYTVTFGIGLDVDDIYFSPNDSCKIYIKKKTDNEYPTEANGESGGAGLNESKSILAYFDEFGVEYDVKAVLTISGIAYEKTSSFTIDIDDFVIDIKEIYPMSAQIEWKYPENYTLVDGESVELYIKYKDEEYLDEPDIKLVQNEEIDLANYNLVELYELIPENEYEVKVILKLLDEDIEAVTKEFTTKSLEITNLKIESINLGDVVISWDLNTKEIGFVEDYDLLSVFIKSEEEEDYDYENPVVELSSGLDDIRNVSFVSEYDSSEKINIMVLYSIDIFETYSEVSSGFLEFSSEETDDGIKLIWTYPTGIEFLYGDRLQVYLKKESDSSYDKEPLFEQFHSKDVNLANITEMLLEGVGIGTYKIKLAITTQNLEIEPIEITVQVGEDIENYTLDLGFDKSVKGQEIYFTSEYNLDIDDSKDITVVPKSIEFKYLGEKDKNGLFKVTNIVPGKQYKSISFKCYDKDGMEMILAATNLKTGFKDSLQEFLSNVYWYAFERYADEGGYKYWLETLLKKQEVGGKYVVFNLMFAEKEFSERNLPDEELIKVLYQIVVNRDYDKEGYDFWLNRYKTEFLPQAEGNAYEAQKTIVLWMVNEQEFGNLCNNMGILW